MALWLAVLALVWIEPLVGNRAAVAAPDKIVAAVISPSGGEDVDLD